MISNELVSVVLRQAFSMNMRPATEQFDQFIQSRLWNPYCQDTKYQNRTPDKKEIFMAGCDQRLIQMMDLERFWKHCKRNAGLTAHQVGLQLNKDSNEIVDLGQMCVKLMVSAINPVKHFLTGADSLYMPDAGQLLSDSGHYPGKKKTRVASLS